MAKIIKLSLLTLILASSYTDFIKTKQNKERRRQQITNNSSYPIKITLNQKSCVKKKEWIIKPGKEKKIFLYEKCEPENIGLTVPDNPNILFVLSQGLTHRAKASFNLIIEYPYTYVYWTITAHDQPGKPNSIQIDATSHEYDPRPLIRKRRRKAIQSSL